jgi:hypothetical protein
MNRFQRLIIALGFAVASIAASGGTILNTRLLLDVQAQRPGNTPTVSGEIYGRIRSITGSRFTVQTRSGNVVEVDGTAALQAHRSVPLVVGHAVDVRGTYDAKGILQAYIILRAKDSLLTWPADR